MRTFPQSQANVMNAPFVLAIQFYRRFISPRKGYSCACAASGLGLSCSTYGLKVFQRFSLPVAYSLQKRQFNRCAGAPRRVQRGEYNPCCIPFVCCAGKCDDARGH
jgi:uncharacterized protein